MLGIQQEQPLIPNDLKIGIAIGAGALLGIRACPMNSFASTPLKLYLDHICDHVGDLLYAGGNGKLHSKIVEQSATLLNNKPDQVFRCVNNIYIIHTLYAVMLNAMVNHFDQEVTWINFQQLARSPKIEFFSACIACLEHIENIFNMRGRYSKICREFVEFEKLQNKRLFTYVFKPIFGLLIFGFAYLPEQLKFYEPIKARSLYIDLAQCETRPILFDDFLDFVENNPELDCVIIQNAICNRMKFQILSEILDILKHNCKIQMLKVYVYRDDFSTSKIMQLIYARVKIMQNVTACLLFCDGGKLSSYDVSHGLFFAAQALYQERALRQRMPLLPQEQAMFQIVPYNPAALQIVPYKPRPGS